MFVTPKDAQGTLLGPGRANHWLRGEGVGGAAVEYVRDRDAKGLYEMGVSYGRGGAPAAVIAMHGRLRGNVAIARQEFGGFRVLFLYILQQLHESQQRSVLDLEM